MFDDKFAVRLSGAFCVLSDNLAGCNNDRKKFWNLRDIDRIVTKRDFGLLFLLRDSSYADRKFVFAESLGEKLLEIGYVDLNQPGKLTKSFNGTFELQGFRAPYGTVARLTASAWDNKTWCDPRLGRSRIINISHNLDVEIF